MGKNLEHKVNLKREQIYKPNKTFQELQEEVRQRNLEKVNPKNEK